MCFFARKRISKVSRLVENYCWGIVAEGTGLNGACLGTRKSIGLVDIRCDIYRAFLGS